MNHYPLWKYLLILLVIGVGAIYALPNLYGEDPAIQISAGRGATIDEGTLDDVKAALDTAAINATDISLGKDAILARFSDTTDQLKAKDVLSTDLGTSHSVALNLAPATPDWLKSINALPMYLGLDLRGGVHFLMEIDMDEALGKSVDRYIGDIRRTLRDEKLRYTSIKNVEGAIQVHFRDVATRDQAMELIGKELRELLITEQDGSGNPGMGITLSEDTEREIMQFALEQNVISLRNRVNELGVAEPVIQRQGDRRIVVQLPGVQDTARAKRILGATATLEYREVDRGHDPAEALESGRAPPGSELLSTIDGRPVLLKRGAIVTGDQVVNARSGFDQQTGSPMVNVTLDGKGARKMLDFTKQHVGDPMAVVYIENKAVTRMVDGEPVVSSEKIEQIINVATIRGVFSKTFQTTGLDSPQEAHELALLLRAGALAAPIRIIEERTVGPSLGKDNIDKGFRSVVIGFCLVLVFMAIYYRVFGLVANMALTANLVLIIAVLSMLQATLTLPGIAGIVLTVGMAVDANVLIFERIREELRVGNSPQASIHVGYAKAFSTIADANITTLIAALVLFSFGTGPIKGFAVTLSIGILTSMFTAIMGTRAVVNLIYGERRSAKLAI